MPKENSTPKVSNSSKMNVLFVTLVLFTVVSKSCFCDEDSCKRLKSLDYQLYGTKTMYETARRYIEKEDDLPDSFSDDSLEKEHKELLEDSCKPVAFYFIGRHSARFPDGEEIDEYNKQLAELKEKLKHLETTRKCPEKLSPFLNWSSRMQTKHDNLITELGARQQKDIARRFKRIYPDFFDTAKSHVKIGITSKLRTAQTAAQFLKEVDGLDMPNCHVHSLPTNDLENHEYNLEKILHDDCYKSMMDKHTLPFLEFHRACERISGEHKVTEPLVERVKDPNVVREIAERVSKKLGLSRGQTPSILSTAVLDSIFDVCKFENAFRNGSVWCTLFEKKDVQALEYIEDVIVYIKNAYGTSANIRQTCPLLKDLVESFEEVAKMDHEEGATKRSYFYFSHAGAMKKLMAAFNMFKDDDDYSEKRVREFVDELKLEKDREWRSSLIVPFSGNMAFIMYRCFKEGKEVKHKILATVTERPVKLGGCKEAQCKSDKFFTTYRGAKDCDLERICAKSRA